MIHDPRKAATGPTEQLHDLPSDTPRSLLSSYRRYLMPTLIIAVCCLILASFHAGSGLPRWQEWGWSKEEKNLFLIAVALGGIVCFYQGLKALAHQDHRSSQRTPEQYQAIRDDVARDVREQDRRVGR